jgi:hypothetical protein
MLVLVEIGVLCLWWLAYCTLFTHAYLSSWLLAYYSVMVSLGGFTLILRVLAW